MANKTLTIWIIFFFTPFLFCQTSGLYYNKKKDLEIEICNDSIVKFQFLNLGRRDSILGYYYRENKNMIVSYSFYNYSLKQVNCGNGNYGIVIEDNINCFEKGCLVNGVDFSTNHISFDLLKHLEVNNEILNLNIINNCSEIQFTEHLRVNNRLCYTLVVKFSPKAFDNQRFSKIRIKNNKSIIVDGIKYYLVR